MNSKVIKSQRNYGIDLLRIISMMLVVLLHVVKHGGILDSLENSGLKYNAVLFLYLISCCAVNCYALISGYVGYGRKIRPSSLIYLWFEVVFYCLILSVVFKIIQPQSVGLGQIVSSFLPVSSNKYWYFTAYFCMFMFTPFFNYLIEKLNKKRATLLALLLIIVFSFYPVLLGKYFGGDLFLTGFGFSPLWLSVLYLIGAYMKKYSILDSIKNKHFIFLYFVFVLLTWILKIVISMVTKTEFQEVGYGKWLICYDSPTIFLCAIFLFLFFANLNLNTKVEKVIKFFAPAAFGVYIIHLHSNIWEWLDKRFVFYGNYNVVVMILAIVATTFAIWLVCSLIDQLRIVLFKLLKIKELSVKIEGILLKLFSGFVTKFCKFAIKDSEIE